MKLRQNLTQPQTSKEDELIKPKPPTKQAINKAKFVDKTFAWRNDARI